MHIPAIAPLNQSETYFQIYKVVMVLDQLSMHSPGNVKENKAVTVMAAGSYSAYPP